MKFSINNIAYITYTFNLGRYIMYSQAAKQQGQDTTNSSSTSTRRDATDEVPHQHETAVSQKLVSILHSGLS